MSDRPQTPEGGEGYEGPREPRPPTPDQKPMPIPAGPDDEKAEWFRKGWEAGAANRSPAPKAVEALREVMSWIKNWSPRFTEDDEWDETKARVDAALSAPRVEAERVGTLTVTELSNGFLRWTVGETIVGHPWGQPLPPGTYEIRPLPAPPETKDDE